MSVIDHQKISVTDSSASIWLADLLAGCAEVTKDDDCLIGGLQLNSQRVQHGDMFIALPGITADGRDYIDQALVNGASAVLFEKLRANPKEVVDSSVPVIGIQNLKEKLGGIASRYFGDPSRHMKVIGVTGTNGKTTTAYLIAQAVGLMGVQCGYSGTLGSGFVGKLEHSNLTTMDAISMHKQLSAFLSERAGAVSMEVSSHGLDQGRANGIDFDIAVFTNLSQDHLDYHQSMTRYGDAKKKLFEFASLKTVAINTDDAFGRRLVDYCDQRQKMFATGLNCIRYGVTSEGLRPVGLKTDSQGIRFHLEYRGKFEEIHSKLLGEVNVPNVLATIGCLLGLGYDLPVIAEVIPQIDPPAGRMEIFRNRPDQPVVIVDYAHTPDALERVLKSLKSLCHGKLVVVFGCGGDRDQGKRSKMGKVAESMADRIILTDDNPRTEPAIQIVKQIKEGLTQPVTVIHDRKQAIAEAVVSSGQDDFILLAGKGHEETQTVGGFAVDLSDRVIVPELLEELP